MTMMPFRLILRRLRSWGASLLPILLCLLLATTAADWLRRPQADARALTNLYTLPVLNGRLPAATELTVWYFWGSWCGLCRHTSPALQQLHQDGFAVASVALQSGDDAAVRAYLHQHGLHFPTLNDPNGTLARQWGIRVTPTIVLVRNGRIVHTTTGISSYWGLRTRLWWARFQAA